jgi:hypothetical protein
MIQWPIKMTNFTILLGSIAKDNSVITMVMYKVCKLILFLTSPQGSSLLPTDALIRMSISLHASRVWAVSVFRIRLLMCHLVVFAVDM